MQLSALLSASIVAIALSPGLSSPAHADTAEATCEVRKDGQKWQGQSGACTFSQRQGYIDLRLRNGDTIDLSPTGEANHFKDQRGNKVVRTQAGGATHEYEWEGGRKITVTVGGSAAGTDALVTGTRYHATAQIPCVAEPGKSMSQCEAGVKRTAGGGAVHVTTPDGGSRVITFRDRKVFSTDAAVPFKVDRRGGWSVVRIGSVEVYEIPDAVVFGG